MPNWRRCTARSCSPLLAAVGLAALLPAQDLLAVKGGRILTLAGTVVEDGTVLIENGRIRALGKASEIEVPWAAKVVDATGKVVLPTWVLAHSQGGLRSPNENMQNVPFLSVADALDPAHTFFEDCLRNGIGTIHALPGNATLLGGTGMTVRPIGRTVEDMAVATQTGLKLSLQAQGGGRLLQIRKLRRALEEAREYQADYDRRKAEFEQEKKAGAIPKDKEWTEEIDRNKKPILDLLQKKIRGWLWVPGAAEVPEALRLQQELDLVLVLGARVHPAIDELKGQQTAVVLDDALDFYEPDPETQKERRISVARMFADAGIPFALSTGQQGPTAYPWWQLATCVRQGVDRELALQALTTVPARLLGLQDQIGTLEPGKLGNLQVLTGDPLQATTWVETIVLEGQVVYERSKDTRLRYLLDASATTAKTDEGK